MTARAKDGAALGLGVLACAACCAGPVVAAVGAVGTLALAWLAPIAAVFVGLMALALVRRRRRACRIEQGPVAVAAPERRAPKPQIAPN